ncbi:HAMP domain-containing histidine kinase [Aggregicoccus sp. 17bor-14]|uniref:ATP-binding response regulator n=1 Tax=Myxococcaceae TaxID=31 RepID=UPI00129D112A|nr:MULTISPECIES: HAMP domain-containing sensor histidine kinase [Myxococcaceae]MBF5045275.1 HAMP domain-containing histidine kinase [Simulacricoccus sp. 17bor-14]MRI91016.1 HAMP domain-containing histidine kinase [Aggregicoccus sp. 17bor-14]
MSRPARVLVVEDEAALLEVFAEVVEGLGYEAQRAHDGEQALLMARSEPPDLVVSDHMMPRRTGVDLMRALRAEPATARVPFVLLSAALPAGREEALAFLQKPVDLATFEATVCGALGERAVPLPAPRRSSSGGESAGREEMLNWVAHELKTPLSAARLHAQVLARKLSEHGPACEPERRAADAVLRQLDRMNGLVSSILDAARLSDGKVALQAERQDLCAWLSQAVDEWRELQPQVRFELRCEEARLLLHFDAARLRQVLDNLLSNAVKYGGERRQVEVGLSTSAGLVVVHVRDWGQGIPASEVPNIFDRFHRADEDVGRGHGLGLYIASALARLHGGSLSVKSALGEGSTFSVRLPLSRS